MKYRIIIGGLVLSLAVAGRVPVGQTAQNCEDLLDNNSYLCHFTTQEGDSFDDCMFFNSADPELGDFDAFVPGLPPMGCSCETKNAKKFKQTKRFLCVTALEPDENVSTPDSISFEGKVTSKGKKIKKGQVVDETGFSYIYTCERDPTCAAVW